VAEWLKAHAWKACLRETVTWVRIPLPPPPSVLMHSLGFESGCKKRRIGAASLPDLWTLRGALGTRGVLREPFFSAALNFRSRVRNFDVNEIRPFAKRLNRRVRISLAWARSHSSIRVRRSSSLIVSTCNFSSIIFWPRQLRPSSGGRAPKEAVASLATETERTSASALAAMQPANGANWPGRRTGLVRRDGGSAR
jgi:hypothetical protein